MGQWKKPLDFGGNPDHVRIRVTVRWGRYTSRKVPRVGGGVLRGVYLAVTILRH